MNKLTLIMTSATALLAACATPSSNLDFSDPVDTPDTWTLGEMDGAQSDTGWLEAIDDATLTGLVERALTANPDLDLARGRLNRARAVLRQSRAAQGPSLNATAQGSLSEGFDGRADTTSYSAGLNASWEADLWGRLSAQTQASDFSAQAAEEDFRAAQHLIAANTAQAYFQLIEANQLAQVEQSNLESLEETLGFVSIQFERGLRSSEDIALIRADVETARASLDLAEQTKRNAARAIEILIGEFPSSSLVAGDMMPTRPAQSLIGQPANILMQRPDLYSAKLGLLAEHARSKSARADLLPRLAIDASFNGANSSIEDLFNPSALAANFVINGTQALFDGGARRARIDAADADREIALATYQALVLDAFNDVETELDRGRVLDRREAFLERALAEAEDALQFSRFRYELGESDLLNVLSIQQRVASLQAELARTRRAALEQYVSLALATGQPIST